MKTRLWGTASAAMMALVAVAGCSGSAPLAPKRAGSVPNEVARSAVQQYDSKHLGHLDAEESGKSGAIMALRADLGLTAGAPLTEEQLAERARTWLQARAARVVPIVTVDLDGKALGGATVTFQPEEFMGSDYHPASVTTGAAGQGVVSGDDPACPGLYQGLYRIQVSKVVNGQETIPARYNSKTELGAEVGPSIARRGGSLSLHLKSH
jgi:hypothetical protein